MTIVDQHHTPETLEAPLYAAIDIGTVTCRLMVATYAEGTLDVLARRSEFVHLGEEVDTTGVLKPEAIARADAQVAEYLQIIDKVAGERPVVLSAIATSASRDAENKQDIIDALAARGVELRVVPGEREAAFCFAGATADFAGERVVVADIGGGSTELIAGVAGTSPTYAHSFQIGVRRMTERFIHTDPPTSSELEDIRAFCMPQFATFFDQLAQDSFVPDRLIAVAGTSTTIVSMQKNLAVYDPDVVHGSVMTLDDLNQVAQRVASVPLEERLKIVGLQPQRASLIVAGTVILQSIVACAGVATFTVSESDMLEGIITLTATGA